MKQLTINGYTLNNASIGILSFIQEYTTHYNDEKTNEDNFNNIRKGISSPIKKTFNMVDFSGVRDLKKTFVKEVLTLVKHNILIYKDNMYLVNVDFYEEIFNTNFNEILPKTKKITNTTKEVLIFLAKKLELAETEKLSFRRLKMDFNKLQSIFKDELLPQEFVRYYNHFDKEIKYNIIYYSDRNPLKDVGKSQLHDYLSISQIGIDYLIDNNIYNIFNLETSDIIIAKTKILYSKLFELFKENDISYTFKSNSKAEVKLFLEYHSTKGFSKFLREKKKLDLTDINLIFVS